MKNILLIILIILLIIPLSTALSTQIQDELVKRSQVPVIITLKDPSQINNYKNSFNKLSSLEKKEIKTSIKEQVKTSVDKTKIKHEYDSFNGFSTTITEKELLELEKNDLVESIELDIPMTKSLQTSTVVINATSTWKVQENGVNLTGLGQTVCIIDTGVNYTHESLGGCTIQNLSLIGNNESISVESIHPYSTNTIYNWTITKPSYTRIALHFSNISTEASYDYIQILDANNTIIAVYSGLHTDLWTPSVEGDTIKIRFTSDELYTYYGFYVDQTINGTTENNYNWSECTKVIGGWDLVNSDPNPYDDDGHGTHVAGIVAGTNMTRGTAPDANIVAIKALDEAGNGALSDAVAGIDWCINRSQEFNISVISMSLGSKPPYLYNSYCDASFPSFASSINLAVSNNITVVIATGNDGNSTSISTPACIKNSTRVARTSNDNSFYTGSNRGTNFDILAAPGTNINSTCMTGGYCLLSGTSMSTPHVAGAAAILQQFKKLQNNTMLTKFQLEEALNSTGKQVYDASSGKYYSRIDIYSSIQSLDESAPQINITKNSSTTLYNLTGILINWTATDNLGIDITIFNISFPSGTIIFSSSSKNNSIELNKSNLTELGQYNISLWANDSSGNQNSINDSFEVINSSPRILSYEPGTENYTMYLGQNLTFNISTQDPLGNPLYYYWYVNSTLVNQSENYTLKSSDYYEDNFTVQFIVSNNDSNTTNNWTLKIIYPYVQINSYEPNSSTISIRKNNTQTFNQTSSDPLGRAVNYSWYINGTLNSTQQNFTLNTTNINISSYNLTLIVTNNDTNASNEWIVNVSEYDYPVQFNFSNNISDYTWKQGDNLVNAFNLSKHFYDLNNETFTYTLMNSSNIAFSAGSNYASFSASSSYYGVEHVWLVANDSNSNISSNIFKLTVTQKPVSNPPSSGGGGGGGGTSTPEINNTNTTINKRIPVHKLNEFIKTFLQAKNKIEINTTNELILENLEIFFQGTHNYVQIKINNIENISTENFTGKNLYKGFEITHSNLENSFIDNATLKFKVEKKWIQENNVNSKRITLYREENGKWTELETSYLTDDNNYNYYESISPGLSLFLIGEKQEEIKMQEQNLNETEQNTKGNKVNELILKIVSAIFSVIAILLVIVILDKMGRKKALKMKEKLEKEQNQEQESIPTNNKN